MKGFVPAALVIVAGAFIIDFASGSGWFPYFGHSEGEWGVAILLLFVASIWFAAYIGLWTVRLVIRMWVHLIRREMR